MAVTTEIPWGDGSSDKIYLTRNASEGNQQVLVSSDANTGAARSKVVTFSASGVTPVTLTVSQAAAALPYDAEVEYLQSVLGAYIDSGISCTQDLSVECRMYWFDNTNASIAGGIHTGTNPVYRHHLTPSSANFYWYQFNNGTRASIQYTASANAWHTFSLNADTGAWRADNATGIVTKIQYSLLTGKNYGIFGNIKNDGGLAAQKTSRCSYFKLSRGGVLLRDFIPVRVGTVGYLYDKVSGQLFGNAGTGDFIIGNDIQ